MKKDLAIIGGLFLAVAGLLIFGKGFTSGQFVQSPSQSSTRSAQLFPAKSSKGAVEISIRGFAIRALVADTQDERKKGLSGKEDLPIGEGVLFVFDSSDTYAIWMKDMLFPIDIIWVDDAPTGEKRIVDIAPNAVPEPKKKDEELKIYRPRSQAKYVLEINAGLVSLQKLQIGDMVNFEL